MQNVFIYATSGEREDRHSWPVVTCDSYEDAKTLVGMLNDLLKLYKLHEDDNFEDVEDLTYTEREVYIDDRLKLFNEATGLDVTSYDLFIFSVGGSVSSLDEFPKLYKKFE